MKSIDPRLSRAMVFSMLLAPAFAHADKPEAGPEFKITRIATYNYHASATAAKPELLSTDQETFNQLGPALLVESTAFLGAACVTPRLNRTQVDEVLEGTRSLRRPGRCQKPSGQVTIRIVDAYAVERSVVVPLSNFAADGRGEIRVPAIVYRTSLCSSVTLHVTASHEGATTTLTKKIDFVCGE